MNNWNKLAQQVKDFEEARRKPRGKTGQTQGAGKREKEKQFLQTIFDHIPIMVSFVGEDGRIKMVNRAWEHTMGWSLEDLKDPALDLMAELYPDPEIRKKVGKFIADSNGKWAEFSPRARSGRVIHSAWAGIRLSDGTWIGIGEDITDRKRAEEALRESEERFRQLAENIREVFWIAPADLSGALYVSPAYENVWGQSAAYMERFASFLETIHPDDRSSVIEVAQRANGQEFAHEYRIVRPGGEVRWIWDRAFPIRDHTGQVIRYAGIAEDITERRRAEEALRESEEQFRQITENISEVIWIYSPDLKRPVYVSPAYDSILGRSRDDLVRDFPELVAIHPEDRARMKEFVSRMPDQKFEVEYRILMPDGAVRWIADRGFPIRDPTGRVIRYVGLTLNITDRKETEEKLKAADEQVRVLAREEERAQIAREMHDELGSALTSLRWDLVGLEKDASTLTSEPRFAGLQAKLQSMLQLTDATIHAVRRLASELRPSILDDLGLMEALESHAKQFQLRTGLALHCQHPSGDVRLNQEESTAVFRIFQEALTNIARHSNATYVEVVMDEQDGKFVLVIRDNGRGIREHEWMSRRSLGCLGMRERARLAGGEIDVTGEEGRGTTVRVQIPISGRQEVGLDR